MVEVSGSPGSPGAMRLSRQETRETYTTIRSTVDPVYHASSQLSHAATSGTLDKIPTGRSHYFARSRRDTAETRVTDGGSRRKVAGTLVRIGKTLGTPAPDAFDDSGFMHGPAADFPTVPGEEERNPQLNKIKRSYDPPRDSDGNATPLARQRSRSRAGSFAGSTASGAGVDGHAATAVQAEEDDQAVAGPSRGSVDRQLRTRRSTLEVPKPVHHSPMPRKDSIFSPAGRPSGSSARDDASQNPSSPSIRVFSEDDT